MPVYNAKRYIKSSIESVLNQNYPNVKLLIINDGSTDGTDKVILDLLKNRPGSKNKVYIKSSEKNVGVSQSRLKLINWSKSVNPTAYIAWLDADDKYTSKTFVRDVIGQMEKTNSNICLVNFSIIYEDENQKNNAIGLLKDKKSTKEVIDSILSTPDEYVNPINFKNILDVTSLGWMKFYAPSVKFPITDNCPFQDFVYMSMLLEANRITALPSSNESIQYLRRSGSICGKRTKENFTHDVPSQLKLFFDAVYVQAGSKNEKIKKLNLAKAFVSRKFSQYLSVLDKAIETKSYPGIDEKVREIYLSKITSIEDYMNKKIESCQTK
jgi:glycosyltransferase involved in cell wall biosynthesis